MRYTILLIICLILISFYGLSQSGKSLVFGKVLDADGKMELAYATVSIYRTIDSSLITYRITNPDGIFKINSLPFNDSLKIIVSYSGYHAYRKTFILSPEILKLELSEIELKKNLNDLEEVIVFSEVPPVIIRNDTIEFNASSFKTLPNALLEDLLKKLPGVVIEMNGSIRVNGNPISKIMVDGKDFFSGDLKIATKNLPANLIDKVQVTNDKEGKDFLPGEYTGIGSHIINLKLKKDLHKGWFGKSYLGLGTGRHYEAGAILNGFADTTQISVIGYSNNINKAGFGLGDLSEMGGFNRSGISSSKKISNGFQINNISFGGTGDGIQTSNGGGFNFNNEFKNDLSINLQYFYGTIKSEIKNSLYSQQKLYDTIYINTHNRLTSSFEKSNNIGLTIKYKPKNTFSIIYNSSILFSAQTANDFRKSTIVNNYNSINVDGAFDDELKYNRNIFSNEITITKKLKKLGRLLNISGKVETNLNKSSLFNFSLLEFKNNINNVTTDQFRRTSNKSSRFKTYFSFTEPLSKKVNIRFSNDFSNISDFDEIVTYYRDTTGHYNVLNQEYSNKVIREGFINTFLTNVSLKFNNVIIIPGIGIQHMIINNYVGSNYGSSKTFMYLVPQLNLRWKEFIFNYSSRGIEPNIQFLNPVKNNVNPFFIKQGNPFLKPTLNHSFYVAYNKFDFNNGSTWLYYLDGAFKKESVIYKKIIGENGIETITPFNIKNNWNLGASISYSKRILISKNQIINIKASLNPLIYKSIVLVNEIESSAINISYTPKVSIIFNKNDKLEINSTYGFDHSRNIYRSNSLRSYNFKSHSFHSEIIIRTPKNVVWENSITYFVNTNSHVQDLKTKILLWNAAVSYLFLSNENAQLRLSVFDILNNNINIQQNLSENTYSEQKTNILKRYISLTFLMNLRNLRERKIGGNDSLLYF